MTSTKTVQVTFDDINPFVCAIIASTHYEDQKQAE